MTRLAGLVLIPVALTVLLMLTAGCGDDAATPTGAMEDAGATPTPDFGGAPDFGPPMEGVVRIPAGTVLDAPTRWTPDNVYVLEGPVFVGPDGPLVDAAERPTLTIEGGTEVRGVRGNLDRTQGDLRLPGTLIVTRNGRINARGSAEAPVIFTSAMPVGERVAGDWGGIVLLGRGVNNVPGGEDAVEGLPDSARAWHGAPRGDQRSGWDCGQLRFVRIEFAGFELRPTEELNGLTVASCGIGTILDQVHVHRSSDDGIEFFGGTVNARRLILTGNQDDSLDWDEGYLGKLQFVVIQHYDASESSRYNARDSVVERGPLVAPDRAIEGDGLPAGVTALDAASSPTLYNLTILGAPSGESDSGVLLRDGTRGAIFNALIAGFPAGAVDIGDEGAAQNALAMPPTLSVERSVFQGFPGAATVFPEDDDDDPDGAAGASGPIDETALFTDPERGSQVLALTAMPVASRSITEPDFGLAFAPEVVPATPPDDGFFDETATFVGALSPGESFTAWTSYPENCSRGSRARRGVRERRGELHQLVGEPAGAPGLENACATEPAREDGADEEEVPLGARRVLSEAQPFEHRGGFDRPEAHRTGDAEPEGGEVAEARIRDVPLERRELGVGREEGREELGQLGFRASPIPGRDGAEGVQTVREAGLIDLPREARMVPGMKQPLRFEKAEEAGDQACTAPRPVAGNRSDIELDEAEAYPASR